MRIGLRPWFASLNGQPSSACSRNLSKLVSPVIRSSGAHSIRNLRTTSHFKLIQQSTKKPVESRIRARTEPPDSLRPETLQQPDQAKLTTVRHQDGKPVSLPNADSLLSEQTVSNKEQRKADWAIIKEMSTYLWPKVQIRRSQVLGINFDFNRTTLEHG